MRRLGTRGTIRGEKFGDMGGGRGIGGRVDVHLWRWGVFLWDVRE